ncbi:MAG: glycosyltransferase family 25 protein, partial [Anaerolineae bacterium]
MNTHDKSELPFYLINLDRSPDRLAMATAEFERIGQAFTRIAGIDGADVPPEYADWVSQELAVQQGNLRMIPGKIGCHLSHLKTAQAFLDSGAEAAVVCEDDVRFAPDFLPVLGEALEAASDWDLLKLSCVTWHFTVERARLPCGARLVEFVRVPGGAACYAISRRGAAKLLRHSRPIVMPFDRSLQRLWVYDLVVLGLDRYLAAGRSDIPSMITGPVDQDWWQDEKQR